jgi:hypothetical protein
MAGALLLAWSSRDRVLQHSVAAPSECQARILSLQNLMHVKSRDPASQKVPKEG